MPGSATATEARSALVIRTGALGDFLLSLPLLETLAERLPLDLVTRRAYRDLLPERLTVRRTLDVSAPECAELFGAGPVSPALSDMLAGAWIHVFTRPDPVLDRRWRDAGATDVTWHDPRPTGPPHAGARFLANSGLPADLDPDTPRLAQPPTSGNSLWIHPGSGSAAKNLPPETLARLAAGWAAQNPGPILLSFGEADESLQPAACRAFASLGSKVEIRSGLSLRQLRDELRQRARLYLGNDTGVSHLAAALAIPSVVFYRVTNPAVWRPLGPCLTIPEAG